MKSKLWLTIVSICLVSSTLAQLPMLYYNCAKMPSICRNVHSRNPLQTVNGGPAGAGSLGKLDPGQTPGGLPYITLHYDTNGANKDNRRSQVCTGTWTRTHPCPEGNQPPTIPSRSSWSHGSWPGVRWNPNGLTIGQSGYNLIANQAGNAASGMYWSCDEWPPAT